MVGVRVRVRVRVGKKGWVVFGVKLGCREG